MSELAEKLLKYIREDIKELDWKADEVRQCKDAWLSMRQWIIEVEARLELLEKRVSK